ncbi:MAG: GerAB/ArcD/ProY family transporter [Clostridia bacterium]|nr:GerAB/ArcD/ProY family transporter [Clostridia bacterium]
MSYTNVRKIGNKEAIWFLVILFVSKILFADINRYVGQSGTAAYIQTIWCAFLAAVIFIVTATLSGEHDIFQASYLALGNVGMKIVGIIISLMLLLNAGVMMRVYAEIISSIALPDASEFFILVALVIAAAFAAFSGIGTLGAYSFAAGIVLVATLSAILILNIPNYDLSNIYPVLGNGIGSILSGVDGLSVYADVFLVFLMATHFSKGTSAKKAGLRAIIISGVVITATTFLYILTVPYPAATEFSLPILEIAFDVNLDVIFQRAEGLFLFLWIFSGFIVIGAYICFSILSFERSFNLSDRRGVIGVFLLIGLGVAMSMESVSLQRDLYAAFYMAFTAVSYGLPLAVFGIRKLRGR